MKLHRLARHWRSALKHVMIVLILAYRRLVSPVLPPSCVFTPSCSRYALDAYEQHGFWRGSWLALRRLLRCWPWSAGGIDPVPAKGAASGAHPPDVAHQT